MKRILFFVVLAALAVSCTKQSYDVVPEDIDDNLYRFAVNTSPYEYFNTPETPVPAGYKPFYISHYGRHGSRSNWGFGYPAAIKRLNKVQEAGALSEEGERALEVARTINRLHNDMNGRLTPRGAKEHRQIAHRMYTKYKNVFRGDRHVQAVSSTSPRCLVSMAAFTGELLSLNPKLDVSWDTGEQYMKYMSSSDPNDMQKEAFKILGEYVKDYTADTAYFSQRIFKDEAAGRAALGGSVEGLMNDLISFAAISGAFDQDKILLELFNVKDLKHYMQIISLDLFLRQCNSAEFGDERMAVPEVGALIKDVIERADEAIASGDCAADLRFGHDYHLLAFCSKIGVKGIGERLGKDEIPDWPGWLYTPFAGNFQMVFYKNKAGKVLVKCFINERETTLLTLPDGPYYSWDAVKAAFMQEEADWLFFLFPNGKSNIG